MEFKINGISKEKVIEAVYNNSLPLRMGWLQFVPGDISLGKVRQLIEQMDFFDYVAGRYMKCYFEGDTFIIADDYDETQQTAWQEAEEYLGKEFKAIFLPNQPKPIAEVIAELRK